MKLTQIDQDQVRINNVPMTEQQALFQIYSEENKDKMLFVQMPAFTPSLNPSWKSFYEAYWMIRAMIWFTRKDWQTPSKLQKARWQETDGWDLLPTTQVFVTIYNGKVLAGSRVIHAKTKGYLPMSSHTKMLPVYDDMNEISRLVAHPEESRVLSHKAHVTMVMGLTTYFLKTGVERVYMEICEPLFNGLKNKLRVSIEDIDEGNTHERGDYIFLFASVCIKQTACNMGLIKVPQEHKEAVAQAA